MASDTVAHGSFEELIQRAKISAKLAEQTYARFSATRRQHWQQLAGAAAEQMLTNRETAEAFLSDPDPNRRIVALGILQDHWKPDAKFKTVVEKMAFDDADGRVRGVALIVLGQCFAGTNDPRIANLFASIVNDSARADSFRKSAYWGLCHVCLPMKEWPDVATYRFPDDVDWNLVQRVAAA